MSDYDPYTPAGEPGVVGPLEYCGHGNYVGNVEPCSDCSREAADRLARLQREADEAASEREAAREGEQQRRPSLRPNRRTR